MNRDRYVIVWIIGFLGAITIASFARVAYSHIALVVIFACAWAALSRKLAFVSVATLFFGLACGFIRFAASDAVFDRGALAANEQTTLEAIVIREPDDKGEYARVVVKTPGNARILVDTHRYPLLSYGDKLELSGTVKIPKNIDDSFDWVAYLAKDGIRYTMSYPEVKIVSSGNGSLVRAKLYAIKRAFVESIGMTIPEPYAAFGADITIGARDGLPKEVSAAFRMTGTSHIVALSGYNISIVAKAFTTVLSIFSKSIAQFFGAAGIILFTLATGAEAATVRASIMALIVILAQRAGRTNDITRALIAAGVLMIMHNPKVLVYDMSFQLSFLATIGIVYLAPLVGARLAACGLSRFASELVSGTLSAQVAVLPLILARIGELSIVALPVNVLILPAIPVAMAAVFAAGFAGLVSTTLALAFSYLAYALLSYVLAVVRFAAGLPFAAVPLAISWQVAAAVYAVLFFFLWRAHRPKESVVRVDGVDIEIIEDDPRMWLNKTSSGSL